MLNSIEHQCPLCDRQGVRYSTPRIEQQKASKSQKDSSASMTVVSLDAQELKEYRTLAIAIEKFPCLDKEIYSLNGKKFLPKAKLLNIPRARKGYFPNRDNLLRLCYLATFKDGKDKFPVTKEEARIFAESLIADVITSKWLGWRGVLGYVLLGGCAAAANYAGLITLINNNSSTGNETCACNATTASNSTDPQSANQTFASSVAFMTAFAFGVATNFAGLWWTGRQPDQSSIKANEQQNRIHLLQRDYLNLSYELIALYCDKEYRPLAEEMAKEIDLRRIANILNDATNDAYASELVGLENLQSVINFIQSEGSLLPRDKALQKYIELCELKTC